MAGVMPANYSGVHSKRTQPIVGSRTHFCKDPPTAGPSTTAQHGKKTRSTPLGCRTTKTFTNGNGNRQCDNLLATLPLFEIALVLLRLDYVGSVPVLPLSRNHSSPAYAPTTPTTPVHRSVLIHLSCL